MKKILYDSYRTSAWAFSGCEDALSIQATESCGPREDQPTIVLTTKELDAIHAALHADEPQSEKVVEPLSVYVGAVVARGKEGSVCIVAVALAANNKDEAIGKMYNASLKEYPQSEGYYGHAVSCADATPIIERHYRRKES